MSWKDDFIERYSEAAYEKLLAQNRARREAHQEQEKARAKKYREEHREQAKAAAKKYKEEHPEKIIANSQELCRKGGKYYEKNIAAQRTGIPGDKNIIRGKHQRQYKPYKDIIAPDSQIHHEWVPDTSEYRGIALVEADQHMHGFVDVIEILDGKITVLTEEEVKNGKRKIRKPC